MRLEKLKRGIEATSVSGDASIEISGVTYDSRLVNPGNLFVALKGELTDGNLFVSEAIKAGAAAVLSEEKPPAGAEVTWIQSPDARTALAWISKDWFDAPDEELVLVGITGTNGKTSVAHIMHTILRHRLGPAGRIGTISYHTGVHELSAPLTTPEALQIHGMLREMRNTGCRSAVMETSSHAIDRKRVLGLDFDVAVFTNLSRDHLDYHGSMEDYYLCKRRLFLDCKGRKTKAVINIDDDWGKRLAGEIELETVTFGKNDEADVKVLDAVGGIRGTRMTIATPEGSFAVGSRLIGNPNRENILAAFAASWALGLDSFEVASAIAEVQTIRGRLELIETGRPFDVMIDYAHSDEALRRLLETAGKLKKPDGRIIVVFGCGGDRDRGKRPLMGKHATELADVAILTSDNPRSEDPLAIIADVEKGIADADRRRAGYHRIPNRREAIRAAVGMARPDDLVVIAGKGHEDYQIIGDQRLHFDDREEALEAIGDL